MFAKTPTFKTPIFRVFFWVLGFVLFFFKK
eukprot:SAG31_NODE_15792_length_738_cov_2.485133_1_plen_29_part_01